MKLARRCSWLALLFPIAACASAPPPPPPPEPEPFVEPEKPLLTLPGDSQVPEAYKRAFSDFLEGDEGKIYARVVEVSVVSNAIAVVLERRIEAGDQCRVGPSKLDIITEDGGAMKSDVSHFGEDCCPGTTCEMVPSSWNVRFINALKNDDLEAFAKLVPAKKKLKYELVAASETGVKKTKKQFSRKDVAAGKFTNPPGCGFVDTTPSCGTPNEKTGKFQCRCDGGGYHVTYDWERDGEGFVIVSISEESS